MDDKLERTVVRQTFAQNDILSHDRFGNSIFLKKPIDELPGPGYYNDNLNIDKIKP